MIFGKTYMNMKEISLKRYLLLGSSFLYIFFIFFIRLYISKFSLSLAESLLYCLVPFLEVSFIYLFFSIIFSFSVFYKRLHVFKYIFFLIGIIYIIQGFTFFISGSFLSSLAIENWRDYQYFDNKIRYLLIILTPIPFCIYYFNIFSKIKSINNNVNKSVFSLFIIIIISLFTINGIRNHSAILSLITNISEIVSEVCSPYISSSKIRRDLSVEKFFNIDEEKEYPFLKMNVYVNNKYSITHNNKPNVIVLFLEGCSARFIDIYDIDNKFNNLTPNIDEFAKIKGVCKVDNYFNHTAATYRGIIGTLTSGYPLHGGFENGSGWENRNNASIYKQTIVSSVPRLLQSFNYKTIMFSPFVTGAPFNDMCKMLYFNVIYTADKSIKELINSNSYMYQNMLSDKGIFLALIKYLSENENDKQAHFISLYNRGTHVFSDIIEGGKKYEDGENQILNRIHNLDYELGKFLRYFKQSSWASNTYLIITTDHATFPEPAYTEIIKQDTPYYFVDRIPLLIYDPYKGLPDNIDANSRNSLDLAPTILNLLGIQEIENSFLGHSLLDLYPYNISMSAIGKVLKDRYIIVDGKIYPSDVVPKKYKKETQYFSEYIDLYRSYEKNNMIFHVNDDND